jgi:hypothetical protein
MLVYFHWYSWIRIRIPNTEPDPSPDSQMNADP